MKGIIIAVVAGVMGTVVWASIVYFTGFEIGWLAWGIGAAVGASFAVNKNRTIATGIIAVAIAVVAILAGKFFALEALISQSVGEEAQFMADAMNDPENEYIISWIADSIVQEKIENGETVKFPDGVELGAATQKHEYPKAIWADAEYQWQQLTKQEQEDLKVELKNTAEADIDEYAGSLRQESYKHSFGLRDIIFFALAIGTAFKIGSGKVPGR